MDTIVLSVLTVTVIGILCAVMLAIASKVMAVKTDERLPEIRETLPGVNCGACGYPGCDGYAAALLTGSVKTNLCIPGGDAVAKKLSEKLGLAYEDVLEKVAVVHCCGDCSATKDKMDYQGIRTCSAAKLLYGGKGSCSFGCLGFGDCAHVCPTGAICMDDGIARVISRLCTGCGLCVSACPKGIISTIPDVARVAVTCSNTDKGAIVRPVCSRGCIACKRCEKECPVGAIVVENNLAVIDYGKCTGCGRCAEVCPVNCILFADFSGANKQK
ncbi:MAG: RnfABCDGE type electron transport complex subunit B [Bacillota bacterium]